MVVYFNMLGWRAQFRSCFPGGWAGAEYGNYFWRNKFSWGVCEWSAVGPASAVLNTEYLELKFIPVFLAMVLCRITWVGRDLQKFPVDAFSEGWLPWITSLDPVPKFDHYLVTLCKTVVSPELRIRLACRFRGRNNLSVVSTFVIYRDDYVKTKSKLWVFRFQGQGCH